MKDFFTKKIGITGLNNGGHHIGDSIVYSSFPENFFLNFNNKIIDLDKYWIFDHNPYVLRGVKPDIIINLPEEAHNYPKNIFFETIVARNNFFGKYKLDIHLTKPNLYIHQNAIQNKSVSLHLTGKSFDQQIPENIINYILNKYKEYKIYQIGGQNDKIVKNTINRLGLSIYDSAKVIAESEIFIGINSGMMHLANCYNNVIKKIILNRTKDESILNIASIRTPQNQKYAVAGFDWYDMDNQLYNLSEQNIGITDSYRLI